jgi:hypothetical protein
MEEAAGSSVIFLMFLHSACIFFSTLSTREFTMDKTVHKVVYRISEMNKHCELNMEYVTCEEIL